jgi:hypothetical protein
VTHRLDGSLSYDLFHRHSRRSPDRARGHAHQTVRFAPDGEWFFAYLDKRTGDLRFRSLLNIAAMTLGEYPDKVPPRFLIPVGPFR